MASSFFTKTTSATPGWTSRARLRAPHTQKSSCKGQVRLGRNPDSLPFTLSKDCSAALCPRFQGRFFSFGILGLQCLGHPTKSPPSSLCAGQQCLQLWNLGELCDRTTTWCTSSLKAAANASQEGAVETMDAGVLLRATESHRVFGDRGIPRI